MVFFKRSMIMPAPDFLFVFPYLILITQIYTHKYNIYTYEVILDTSSYPVTHPACDSPKRQRNLKTGHSSAYLLYSGVQIPNFQ